MGPSNIIWRWRRPLCDWLLYITLSSNDIFYDGKLLNYSELPFNQVPTLEVDGAVISFNKPIQAFLGKRLGKY